MPNPGGTIYAIGAVGTTLVKVGRTKTSVEHRRQQLQTGQPFALEVLATVAVETHLARIEKQVHAFLEAERRRGEWFDVAMDRTHLEALVVRAVQYITEQEEIKRLRQQAQEVAKRRVSGLRVVHVPQLGERLVSLGREMKKARIGKGWNQKRLQDVIGVSQKHISAIELDKVDPRWSMVKRLAGALDISLDMLA